MTVARHRVVTVRSGDWWEIEVTSGLPGNVLGVSQARSLTEVEDVARNLISDLLDVSVDDVSVEVKVAQPTRSPVDPARLEQATAPARRWGLWHGEGAVIGHLQRAECSSDGRRRDDGVGLDLYYEVGMHEGRDLHERGHGADVCEHFSVGPPVEVGRGHVG